MRKISFAVIVISVMCLFSSGAAWGTPTGTFSIGTGTWTSGSTNPADHNCAWASGVLTVRNGADIQLTGTSTRNSIVVTQNANVNITLQNVNINVSGNNVCAFDVQTGATVNLTLNGTNVLRSGKARAGLEVPAGATLTINGNSTDQLTVNGGEGVQINTGTPGGFPRYDNYGGGTGIGGGGGGNRTSGDSGTIIINGGVIMATGGNGILTGQGAAMGGGAGIGGGGGGSGSAGGAGGTITVNHGIVAATGGNGNRGSVAGNGGDGGAGIGGGSGRGADGGTFTINGGTVTATGGNGGDGGSGIVVPSGGGRGGAGIGGGNGGMFTINDGIVTAIGGTGGTGDIIYGGSGHGGAGIGTYSDRTLGRIAINGGTVAATGGNGGDRTLITSGVHGQALSGTITLLPQTYTYWTNTININPGGTGTTVPQPGPAFSNNNNPPFRFVRIVALSDGDDSLVWRVAPPLGYDFISYSYEFGFTAAYANDSHPNRFFIIDEKTGNILQTVEWAPMGGYRDLFNYGFYPNTGAFFYNEQYSYHPEENDVVFQKSQNAIIGVHELEIIVQPDGSDYYEWKEGTKVAIYYNGRFVSDFVYDWVIGGNAIAFVRQNDKYAIADNAGNLLTGFVYDEVALIAKEYVAVRIGNTWGFVYSSGQEVIPFIFDSAVNIDADTAFVKYDGEYGILDVKRTADDTNNDDGPTITTISLPEGTTRTAYRRALNASGTRPITWSIDRGNLPNGLGLSGNGVISGTPMVPGTFNFTVRATNSVGTDAKDLSIVITASASESESGGCDAGFGVIALLLVGFGLIRKPRKV